MKFALTGNPNSGKTTMYNALTGRNEKVGNWAGVTVEKKENKIKKVYHNEVEDIIAVDLPGAYSMSPFTSEESITSEYVREENPDVIINIVDATNLSRSLFFTTQLLELGIPVVVALNKEDLNNKKENKINTEELSKKLGCPVIETTATSGKGLKLVIKEALSVCGKKQNAPYSDKNIDLTNKEAAEQADRERFEFVNEIVSAVEKRKTITKERNIQDKIDNILTHKVFGILIFAVIMFGVFWISQSGPAVWVADLIVGWLEQFQGWIAGLLTPEGQDMSIWTSILIDGVLGGVIAVVGFLPLVMIMYFLITLLEDCGYMARASVVLDPIFKKVGLSGKSVIPFVIGTGCAIPGVMACRTIRDERERRATAMLAPFMPCGAKLPVIALIAGVFFADAWWVGPSMYLIGITIIFFGALLINLLTGHRAKKSYFIIELPEYKFPDIIKGIKSMCQRGWAYIVKAGTIILVCNFIIHVMQTFNWNFEVVTEGMENTSILASIATPFAYVIAPVIGIVSWQLAAAAITGFIAKENVVGTIAMCFAITNFIDIDELVLMEGASEVAQIMGIGNVAALAFLMFNLFTPPCFAAIGAMNSEIKSKKWLFGGIGLQFSVGYTIAFLVFFFGALFTGILGSVDLWMIILGWVIVLIIVTIITLLIIRKNKELKNNVASKTLLSTGEFKSKLKFKT